MKTIIINQSRGLGDILFSVPLLREYVNRGYRVIWPVAPEYASIAKHFPEFTILPDYLVSIDYNSKAYDHKGIEVLPLRFSDSITKQPYSLVMRAKYDMVGMDFKMWRELTWVRDLKAEQNLFNQLGITGEYVLVNQVFRTDKTGAVQIKPDTDKQIITMRNIDSFTLLDWLLVMQMASEIYTVGTSINFMIDIPFAEISCPVHLYIRRPDETGFNYYDYLLERGNYIYHSE